MADQLEARIVVKGAEADGRHEIICHDPQTGRDVRTGLKVSGADVERQVRQLKGQLEQAGNRVTGHEV